MKKHDAMHWRRGSVALDADAPSSWKYCCATCRGLEGGEGGGERGSGAEGWAGE